LNNIASVEKIGKTGFLEEPRFFCFRFSLKKRELCGMFRKESYEKLTTELKASEAQ